MNEYRCGQPVIGFAVLGVAGVVVILSVIGAVALARRRSWGDY